MVTTQRRRGSSINPVDRVCMLINVEYIFVRENALNVSASLYSSE